MMIFFFFLLTTPFLRRRFFWCWKVTFQLNVTMAEWYLLLFMDPSIQEALSHMLLWFVSRLQYFDMWWWRDVSVKLNTTGMERLEALLQSWMSAMTTRQVMWCRGNCSTFLKNLIWMGVCYLHTRTHTLLLPVALSPSRLSSAAKTITSILRLFRQLHPLIFLA